MKLILFWLFVGVFCCSVQPLASQGPKSEAERKLKDAFGPDFKLVRDAKFKFELVWGDETEVRVLACDQIKFIEERKVRLTPGHYALYVKEKDKKDYVPKLIGLGPSADYTFDRPVKTIEEMQKAKIKSIYFPSVLNKSVR